MSVCPNCRYSYTRICTRCGYDRATGVAKFTWQELGLSRGGPLEADIWIASFPTEAFIDSYVAEAYPRDDDEPISRFAAEQEIGFYDHDFFVANYGVRDFAAEIEWLYTGAREPDLVLAAFERAARSDFNALLMQVDELAHPGRSVSGSGYWVHYLGRFAYEQA